MAEETPLPGGLMPLGMTCTSTDCPSGLHYFRPKPPRRRKGGKVGAAEDGSMGGTEHLSDVTPMRIPPRGSCRVCGADLVDWDRVTRRDLTDVAHTFEELRKERIRHYFWHVEIDERAVRHARRKGKSGMREAAEKRIRQSVGNDTGFDGRQTPTEGNALYYAQHATASCCRKCIEEWHAIPRGRSLIDEEVSYLTKLVLRYIDERLPFLTDDGEKVAQLRSRTNTEVQESCMRSRSLS